MLSIETSRLRVFPLPLAQLRLWAEDLPALERSLGYAYRGVPVEKALGDARRLLAAAEEAGESPYRTVWMLVQREEGVIIGSAGFKGGPDEKGEVEIRYAMGKDYRRRGYMTEAVKAICCWALEQPEVAHITAETDLVSYPSQRIQSDQTVPGGRDVVVEAIG